MNIGIDIDDTIAETFETLIPYAQKYTIEDLKRKSNIDLRGDISNHFYIVYINGWNEQEAIDFLYDDIPEQAFYMVGTIEEVLEKAESMKGAA